MRAAHVVRTCGPREVLQGRFCRSCIATSLKNNKWTCPYCRAYLPSEGVPATDVAKKMKSEFQNCTECDTLVCLSEMRAHIRTCQKYIAKYGPLQELGETATRCVCPFCQKELDEDSLLDHCITHHRSERRPFCPLCHLVPNENPSSFNGSLIRHLQVSHTLFYDDFIDFNIIEEALIQRVLDRSLLEYEYFSKTYTEKLDWESTVKIVPGREKEELESENAEVQIKKVIICWTEVKSSSSLIHFPFCA
eukprot:bmy_13025T0